jgi:hypothetical protein
LNALPFDREDTAAQGLATCKTVLDAGRAILIFPEGTRSVTGELQSFKPGVGVLGIELDVPVIPVLLRGTLAALPKGRALPRPARISLRIGKPLYFEALKKERGADWVRVPFRGGGEAVNAILSGSTPVALFGEGNVIGNVRAGKMTPLLMMNNIKSPNFPEVPLLSDTGYKGAPSQGWYGLFAPAATPKAIVDKIAKDVAEVVGNPAFRERHLSARSLVSAVNSPEKFAEEIKRDRATAQKVVKDSGLEPQ